MTRAYGLQPGGHGFDSPLPQKLERRFSLLGASAELLCNDFNYELIKKKFKKKLKKKKKKKKKRCVDMKRYLDRENEFAI